MPDNDSLPAGAVSLFDGEDVDVGQEAPDDEDQAAEELAGIESSQEDPNTPPADTVEAS
jgi:hypothetical protein